MIIGFSGSFGAGKSSRAEYLAIRIPSSRYINFADALKEMIKEHFNLSELDKTKICPKYGISYGQVLQKFGQGMRDIDPDFWLDKVKHVYETTGRNLIIGDVRYQNELDWILEQGGMVFHKQGSLETSIAGRDLNHPSEQFLNGYTLIFPMETSVEEDCAMVLKMINKN